jgi:hypothetical protein
MNEGEQSSSIMRLKSRSTSFIPIFGAMVGKDGKNLSKGASIAGVQEPSLFVVTRETHMRASIGWTTVFTL